MDGNGCRFFDQYEKNTDEIIIEWDGGCRDGYLTGSGILKKYKSGEIVLTFEGELEKGNYKSRVKWNWPDGKSYVGEIKNSNMTGKGKFIWPNGNEYEGDFVNGEKTGKGKYTFANGELYEGDFISGVRTGKGKYTFKNGDLYEGDFVNNKYHGWGKLKYNHGDVFEGEFKNGFKNGQGKYTYANSTTYTHHNGIYKNDKKNGPGKLFYPDGTFIEGYWSDDQMSTNKPSGSTDNTLNSKSDVKYSNNIYSNDKPASSGYATNSNPSNRPSPAAATKTKVTKSDDYETEVASVSSVVPMYKWDFQGYWTSIEGGQFKRNVAVMRNGLQHKMGTVRYLFNNDDNSFYIDVVGLEQNFSFVYKPELDNQLQCINDKHIVFGVKDLEGAFFQSMNYSFTSLYK
jgi:hypothetical protein